MARCIGVNQPPRYCGVDGLWCALDDLNAKADKLDTILEELHVVIVGGRNVHKNHEDGYYSVIRHPIVSKGGFGSASRSYQHLVNMKKSIPYSDFLDDERYVHFDNNPNVEIDESQIDDDALHQDI
ncbi:hypothetical protein L1987_41664 [Smallanthus sonchifolius]|uniref:Uncharacterized protein n=1 Tax=Smallanthus sonchifolius TaxID=185202 RepID=A0ACB9GWF4_9ASTR|nr:hypothetical protein L1987_41664 [Smallanthus sonchifolius]